MPITYRFQQNGNRDILTLHISHKIHTMQYGCLFEKTEEGIRFSEYLCAANGVNGIHCIYPHEIAVMRSRAFSDSEVFSNLLIQVCAYFNFDLNEMEELPMITVTEKVKRDILMDSLIPSDYFDTI